MIYTHAAGAIAGAALSAWLTWQVQDWRFTDQVHAAEAKTTRILGELAAEKQDRQDQLLRARASALEAYTRMESTKNAAIEKQTQRAEANRLVAAGLRRDVDGLRDQLATVPARIATASHAAVADYAATATKLFAECTREYAEVAERADGHAIDVQALNEAWPMTPSHWDAHAGFVARAHLGRTVQSGSE